MMQAFFVQNVCWNSWQTIIRCDRCYGLVRPVEWCSFAFNSIRLVEYKLEAVDTFSYLFDTVSTRGGLKHGAILRARFAWKSLGNYCHFTPVVISTSKLKERFSIYLCDLPCCMVLSAGV